MLETKCQEMSQLQLVCSKMAKVICLIRTTYLCPFFMDINMAVQRPTWSH